MHGSKKRRGERTCCSLTGLPTFHFLGSLLGAAVVDVLQPDRVREGRVEVQEDEPRDEGRFAEASREEQLGGHLRGDYHDAGLGVSQHLEEHVLEG